MWLLLSGTAFGATAALAGLESIRRQWHRRSEDDNADPSSCPTGDAIDDVAVETTDSDVHEPCHLASPSMLMAAAVAAAGALLAVTCGGLLVARGRSDRSSRRSRRSGGPPRIPLRELVRFREQEWFLEELENARDGDPNAMLRLAKMYLYGQGCERSVNIAQEWLRRARAGGVYCTLDELLTAEDLEAFSRQARASSADRQQQLLQRHQQHRHPQARPQSQHMHTGSQPHQGRQQAGGIPVAAA
ncbi:hypothetical protein Agub_g4457 [Astrephomene gubernaculifera]|uniref:Uncharacterized protein n=1 Tax=Astrephomene gubernaculifera TaxID=47775 RepID=A0AAD3HJW4_9CHLO|nr:hypothetical protein Agub_g4457 [Astrephomene gubernaculifera]